MNESSGYSLKAVTIEDVVRARPDLAEFTHCLAELLQQDPLVQSPDGKYFVLTKSPASRANFAIWAWPLANHRDRRASRITAHRAMPTARLLRHPMPSGSAAASC